MKHLQIELPVTNFYNVIVEKSSSVSGKSSGLPTRTSPQTDLLLWTIVTEP
jgi:hypothetical protein